MIFCSTYELHLKLLSNRVIYLVNITFGFSELLTFGFEAFC